MRWSIDLASQILVISTLAILLVGCDSSDGFVAPDQYCASQAFAVRRCDAIAARAIELSGQAPRSVLAIELGAPAGRRWEMGGNLVATARLSLADGRRIEQEVWCVGVGTEFNAWCTENPTIEIWAGGYHDIPCAGEPPAGCPSPIVLDPEAVAAARPLRIPALDIPVTVGSHDVVLGSATIPNGYLSSASFTLADLAPVGVLIPDGIRLTLRPTDPTRPPLGNVYERGTFPGVEVIEASLSFDVEAAPDGAVLQVRDVVVE